MKDLWKESFLFSEKNWTNSVSKLLQGVLVRCAIQYHVHNLKNVKNTHRGVLLLVKLNRLQPATLLKVTLLHGCFLHFLNCTNGTKSRNALQILIFILTCNSSGVRQYFKLSVGGVMSNFRSPMKKSKKALSSETDISGVLQKQVFLKIS